MITLRRYQHKLVNTFLATAIITTLSACQSDSQTLAEKPRLSEQENQQLLLNTKQAILALDIDKVASLSDKIDVNAALPDKSNLLAWAVETQDPRLVSLLLEKGAIATTTTSNPFTPLIQACRYGEPTIINALLDGGADPNSAIEDGTSALQLCAGSASPAILTKMHSLGADLTTMNQYGQTALMFAANAGNTANMEYLITAGADINQQTSEGYSALFFAIKSQNLNAVKMAITQGADLFATAQDGTTAAQLGVYTKNYAFLNWFAENLPTLMTQEAVNKVLTAHDRDGYQLLHAAVKANQPELVATLLALGASPTAISEPSTLKWRYEANFKTQDYIPPQLTPIEIAERNKLTQLVTLLQNAEGTI